MIYRYLTEVEAGSIVSRPIYSDDGRVLLKPGTVISDRYVQMLRRRGIPGLYLVDKTGNSQKIPTVIDDGLRGAANHAIASLHISYREIAASACRPPEGVRVLAWLTSVDGRSALESMPRPDTEELGRGIVEQVLSAASDAILRMEKGVSEYAFGHSVDVAAIAVAIGKRLNIAHAELVDLACGALVHDIGMSLLDPAIVNKPGPLTDVEMEQIRMHPRLGFEMLHAMDPDAMLSNHIALQHHECQDGSGYPQGLHGLNHVGRNAHDPARSEMIGLAEICAAADVYDALSSPRPYRAALPPDQVRATMRRLSGTKLNLEAVDTLLEIAPLYPVGGKVTLICRQFPRHRGLVVRRNLQTPDRPVIRLYTDDNGTPVEPLEIDLSVERGILIRPAV